MAKAAQKITTSSTAEYFSKNLQQVGFSSLTKSVLTTLKEAVDNALDACEDAEILPEVHVEIEKLGAGSLKNSDKIRIKVTDNGPGLPQELLAQVFGEYLASSKFGKGRCSRGQQGIGISAATTWAQLTNAQGALVISKTEDMRKAVKALIEVDIKNNKGIIKSRETIDWDQKHGVSVEFFIDGRIQLNGEGGLLSYISGTTLVNPHLTLHYEITGLPKTTIERVTTDVPAIPDSTEPHPHTMKLGEFIAHSHLFGRVKASAWLKKGFSRVTDATIDEIKKTGVKKAVFEKNVDQLADTDFREIYTAIQNIQLMAPSTRSVLTIGEDAMGNSVRRLGNVDFFSVVTRKPTICDFKPVEVEVAIARIEQSSVKEARANAAANAAAGAEAGPTMESEDPVTVLRFANRVPLQFDKSACAIVKALETVNWRSYGLAQPKNSIPLGPYVMAVSVISPFIKFKNASKETIDASDELVTEIRLALIQAGQRLAKHIKRETKANDLEQKLRYIEQFCPILVDGICRITKAPDARKKKATEGIVKILGRDARDAEKDLKTAEGKLEDFLEKKGPKSSDEDDDEGAPPAPKTKIAVGKAAKEAVKTAKSEKSGKKGKKSKNASQEAFDFGSPRGGK